MSCTVHFRRCTKLARAKRSQINSRVTAVTSNAETNSANRSNSYTPGTNWAQDARNLNQAEQQQNNSYINGSEGLTNQDMPQSNF